MGITLMSPIDALEDPKLTSGMQTVTITIICAFQAQSVKLEGTIPQHPFHIVSSVLRHPSRPAKQVSLHSGAIGICDIRRPSYLSHDTSSIKLAGAVARGRRRCWDEANPV